MQMNNKPTETQINLWKTYAKLVQNLDLQNGDADGQHELNQYDAIKQISKDTSRNFDDVRKDINVVCDWLTASFTKRSK